MTRLLLGLAAVIAGTALVVGQHPIFSSKVDVVLVDVQVTEHGRPVRGLTATHFEVLDNGVRQRIDTVFGGGVAAASVPLDLVLVFDVSSSIAGPTHDMLTDASRALLEGLRPGDRVALLTFCERVQVLHPLSSDPGSTARALAAAAPGGRTSMFDGLYTGLMLPRDSRTRAAVLLFSDGLDNASWLDEPAVRKVARESDVAVYGVGLDGSVRNQLEAIVEETGGALITADSVTQLKSAFQQLLSQMQSRYVLGYSPQDVAHTGWHALDVRLTGRAKGRQIRARRGYFVAPAREVAR